MMNRKSPDLPFYRRNELVKEFIHRRFYNPIANEPEDFEKSHWMTGNCFWFAHILCSRFRWLEMCYDPIKGHFLAFDHWDNVWYDYTGSHEDMSQCITLDTLKKMDPLWYDRLMHDCAD